MGIGFGAVRSLLRSVGNSAHRKNPITYLFRHRYIRPTIYWSGGCRYITGFPESGRIINEVISQLPDRHSFGGFCFATRRYKCRLMHHK